MIWKHVCDLNHLFVRFAKHETFSKETKGGAEEHNLKLIPFYIQFIINQLKQNKEKAEAYTKRLNEFCKANEAPKKLNENANFDDFVLVLSMAVILADVKTWNESLKPALLNYMLSYGSNIIKGKGGSLDLPVHNIKAKIMLSPKFGKLLR